MAVPRFPTNSETSRYQIITGSAGLSNTLFLRLDPIESDLQTFTAGPYYFDGSVVSVQSNNWTNAANVFDGDEGTFGTGAISATGTAWATGTTAPSSGGSIRAVNVRYHIGNASETAVWGGWRALRTPRTGWTWPIIQNLRCDIDARQSGFGANTMKVFSNGELIFTEKSKSPLGINQGGEHDVAKIEIAIGEPIRGITWAVADDNDEVYSQPLNYSHFRLEYEVQDGTGDDSSVAMFSHAGNAGMALGRRGQEGNNEEELQVRVAIEGLDVDSDILDVPEQFFSHENTNSPDPPSITTVTDGCMIVAITSARSDSGTIAATGSVWDTSPPSGYTIESAATAVDDDIDAAMPGRSVQGTGAGDVQQTFAYKIQTSAGVENPGTFSGFSTTRDHKITTVALRPLIDFELDGWRFRTDDGSESGATWLAAAETDITVDAAESDVVGRIRFAVKNGDSRSAGVHNWYVVVQKTGSENYIGFTDGPYIDGFVGTVTNDTATTQQISSGSFKAGVVKSDPAFDAFAVVQIDAGDITEVEFTYKLFSSDLTEGDVLKFWIGRTVTGGIIGVDHGTLGDGFPTITIGAAAPSETATDDVDVIDATPHVLTIIRSATEAVGTTDTVSVPVVVEQKVRPVSDDVAAGWDTAPTGSQPLWEQVDEETPSDTDYMFTETP